MALPVLNERAEQVKLGPGYWMFAPLGTDFPIDLTGAVPATGLVTNGKFTFDLPGWKSAGYNDDDGTTFAFSTTVEGRTVAQRLTPIKYAATEQTATATTTLSQTNQDTLKWALAGGSWSTGGSGDGMASVYTPPKPEDRTKFMALWISSDEDEFLFAPQVTPSGELNWVRGKGVTSSALSGLTLNFEESSEEDSPGVLKYDAVWYYGTAGDWAAAAPVAV